MPWHKISARNSLCFALLRLVAIAPDLDASKAIGLAFRATFHVAPWPSLLQVLSKPAQDELSETAIARGTHSTIDGGEHLVSLVPLLDSTKVHMGKMSRPTSEVIQNMSSVDDGTFSNLRLTLEPGQKLSTAQNVEIDSDFIEE